MRGISLLLSQVKEEFNLPVLTLIYGENHEILEKDIDRIIGFFGNVGVSKSYLILHGDGGYISAVLTLAIYLRNQFKDSLCTVIPKKAGSANGYIALISNQVILVEDAYLTQFDLTFFHKNKIYRALNELENSDKEIKQTAQHLWKMSFKIIKKIISRQNSLSNYSKKSENYIREIMSICMKGDSHGKKINYSELKKLNFNVSRIGQNQESANMLRMYVDFVLKEINKRKKRFFVACGTRYKFYS